jgi:hypothetical protein
MKLIINDLEFELMEVPHDRFLLAQENPYPMEHILYREDIITVDSYSPKKRQYNTYLYKSIQINNKYYCFKLIDKNTNNNILP